MAKDRMRKQYQKEFFKKEINRKSYVDPSLRREGKEDIETYSQREKFTPDKYGRKSY